MSNKAVISLTAGLEDSEKVTVAFLVLVAAAEKGRPALMSLTEQGGGPAHVPGFAHALACDGFPTHTDLIGRYGQARGRFLARSASTRQGQPHVQR
jgi:hypothetical protein